MKLALLLPVLVSGFGPPDDMHQTVKRYLDMDVTKVKSCDQLEIGEEVVPPGEAYQTQENAKLMGENLRRRDIPGYAKRSFHPKSHGCLHGKFTVDPNLATDLQLGPFQPGMEYPVWSNWATATPLYPQNDGPTGTPIGTLGRSVGLKMFGLNQGKSLLPGFEDVDEMHFLMNNGQGFWCNDLKCFFSLVTAYLHGDLSGSGIPKFAEKYPEAMGRLMQENAEGHIGHMFNLKYWGQAPFSFGKGRAFKYFIQECSEDPMEVHSAGKNYGEDEFPKVNDSDDPNVLRNRLRETMGEQEACFSLWFQFQEDTCKQPIEDGSAIWELDESPPRFMGDIIFPKQELPEDPETDPHCQNAGFQPYQMPQEFKPLGGLNRGRKLAYSHTIAARQGFNNYANFPKGAFPCCGDGTDVEPGRDTSCNAKCEDQQSPSVGADLNNLKNAPVPRPEL